MANWLINGRDSIQIQMLLSGSYASTMETSVLWTGYCFLSVQMKEQ